MKKKLLLLLGGLFFSGCVGTQSMLMPNQNYTNPYANTNGTTNQQYITKPNLEMYINNPILNVETDLILAEELATMVKMNNLLLDRMPISYEDKWPELLRDFQKNFKNIKDKKAKEEYTKYLEEMLKKDYSFYQIYDPSDLKEEIKRTGGFALVTNPSAMKKIVLLKIVESYGKNLEHLKNVISYQPLGCGAKYPNPEFEDMFRPLKANVCTKIENRFAKKCEFFSKPIEDILYEYEDGFFNLKVGPQCFKVVRGHSYPSFKAAFYELLPNSKRDAIREADEDLQSITYEIADVKSQIRVLEEDKKNKEKNQNKIAALKKKLKELEKKEDNIKDVRSKLFEEAMNQIVIDKDKAKLAQKLKIITDYMNHNLTSVGIGTVILTVNTFLDIREILSLGGNSQNAIMMTAAIFMADKRAKNMQEAMELAKKRLKLLLQRAVRLPKNAVVTAYAIGAQKSFLSDYIDYIEAVIEAGKKAGHIKDKK